MKILLVEDDPKAARLLARGLDEEGYAVTIAASAEQAALLEDGGDYALVVLDWMLPGQDGVALCRAWRQRGMRLPVLMLTARDALGDRVAGLDSGADDYLVKPFEFAELLARLRALLRRTATPASPAFIGDLGHDVAARAVSFGGRGLQLTPKEYAILVLLAALPGELVERSQLATQVWQADLIAIDNLIDVHVKNLRRKVAGAGSTVLIETVRGQGFRLGRVAGV